MGEAVAWWIAIELLGLVALPIAAVVLRALPDRGYCVSKPLGLLLTGWLAYMLAMLGVAPFTRPVLAGCVVVLAAGAVALLLRNGRAGWVALRAQFRTPAFLRYLLTSEILFTLAFAVWAYLRAYNPNIVDQEKFMDFGFLNAILRSGTFPPHDMWLAGQSINYYYFGYVLIAAWTSLSGVPSEVAFNLADAGLFALTALGAFGIVYNLIAGTLQRQYSTARSRRATAERAALTPAATPERAGGGAGVPVRRARAGGAATAAVETAPAAAAEAATGADGDGAAEPVPPASGGNGAHAAAPPPDDDGAAAWRLPRLPVFLSPYLYGLLAALMIVAMGNLTTAFAIHTDNTDEGNGWRFCFMCQTPQSYNWFAPSRIIQDYRTVSVAGGPPTKEKVGFETINEFPAFSFLLGDLHPHVLALPLVLLALAFGVALARRRPRPGSGWRDALPDGVDGWLGIAVAAVSAGALYTANTWDYPTYLLILLGCLGLPYLAARRRTDPAGGWRWARPWLVQAALLVVLSLVVFLPFHLTFVSLVGGGDVQVPSNLAQIPVLGGILQKIGALLLVNTADKTILGFLVIFGIFLLAIVAWVVFEAIRYGRTRAQRADAPTNLFAVWGGGVLAVLIVAWVLQFPLLALLLPLGVAALYLIWQQPARPERNTVLLLVAVGAFLGLAIEVFFLRDNFQMRMNTLFKFYFQIWVLWGLAAAYAVWRTLHTVFREPHAATAPGQISGTRALSVAWAGVFVLLVASGLLYSVYGPLARQVGGQAAPRGLDGMTWLRDAAPGDYAAIVWLKDRATSSDVVLEAGSDEYNRPGRVSAYTGVPTLVAWDNSHESLWRTGQPALRAQIQERRQVVNAIYQGRDPQTGQPLTAQRLLDLLHQYGVDYVFAGATERGVPGFAPSKPEEQMTPYAEGLFQQALPVAFHSGTTVVYAVQEGIAGTGIAPAPQGITPAPGAQATVDAHTPPVGLFDASGPGAGRGQLTLPRGIARDTQGNFYVADTQNLRIEKFDPAGAFLTLFGGSGTGPGQFAPLRPDAEGTGPGGVAVDAAGNVYVADTWNHRIQKFDPTGKFLLQWGSFVDLGDPNGTNAEKARQGFYGPRGVAVGPDGNLYVTDTGNKRVVIFDANGGYVREISSGVSPTRRAPDYPFTQPGELNEPIGIAVDSAGNVYVADTNNRRIQKFTATGAPAAQWPVPAGSWQPGPYLEPFLALDGAGNLYATAPTSHSVLKFSPTGTLLGQKSAQGDATLQLPTGLTVDAQGTVYVVDTTASRVVNLGAIP